ncbi:MAG TPA: hypothetical protein VL593_14525 [Ramlibacter sp.]|nr:hypothetical protein [Ramlibacter sp.]
MNAVLSRPLSDDDMQIQAYNGAFEELGLQWYWDRSTWAALPPDSSRVLEYVQREHPHLLRSYDGDFLVTAVESARARHEAAMRSRRQHAANA